MIKLMSVQDGGQVPELRCRTCSVAETEELARLLAESLVPGCVISLDGDLGAGKTAFTRGLASGLACRGSVASPTFTLLMEHPPTPGGLALYHFDVYRLEGELAAESFLDLGFAEYFDSGGVCVIEWGQLIESVLPANTFRVTLSCGDIDQQRDVSVRWPGGESHVAGLAARVLAWQSRQI